MSPHSAKLAEFRRDFRPSRPNLGGTAASHARARRFGPALPGALCFGNLVKFSQINWPDISESCMESARARASTGPTAPAAGGSRRRAAQEPSTAPGGWRLFSIFGFNLYWRRAEQEPFTEEREPVLPVRARLLPPPPLTPTQPARPPAPPPLPHDQQTARPLPPSPPAPPHTTLLHPPARTRTPPHAPAPTRTHPHPRARTCSPALGHDHVRLHQHPCVCTSTHAFAPAPMRLH